MRRRKELGQSVFVLDPFGLTGKPSSQINPLRWINPEDQAAPTEILSLLEAIVVRETGSKNPYWDDSAADLLRSLLLHVSGLKEEEQHLGTVRDILTRPESTLTAYLEDLAKDTEASHGLIARGINAFLAKAPNEKSGVLSTAQQHTAFLDDPRVVETLKNPDVDFSKLKTKPQTVYLCIPPDMVRPFTRYIRMVVGLAIKGMTRTQGLPKIPTLFLIDEFAQLGHFDQMEDAISILRGYGGHLWLFVQDLSQLKAVYSKWETFLSNSVLQVFGTQDVFTAKYISDALGKSTIEYATETTSSGSSDVPGKFGKSTTKSTSSGVQRVARDLMTPDEVRRLGSGNVIAFEQGFAPVKLWQVDYREDEEYKGLYDRNPMYGSVSGEAEE